jgi:hypothetical protein
VEYRAIFGQGVILNKSGRHRNEPGKNVQECLRIWQYIPAYEGKIQGRERLANIEKPARANTGTDISDNFLQGGEHVPKHIANNHKVVTVPRGEPRFRDIGHVKTDIRMEPPGLSYGLAADIESVDASVRGHYF